MGAHRDAEVSEVVVVLSDSCEGKVEESIDSLRQSGLEVCDIDVDNLTISGTIESAKLPALRSAGCVNYVRVSMTYIADYPADDPRDRDGTEDEDDELDDATVWSPLPPG